MYNLTIQKYNENFVFFEVKYIISKIETKNLQFLFEFEYFDEKKTDVAKKTKNDVKWKRRNYKKTFRYVNNTWLT